MFTTEHTEVSTGTIRFAHSGKRVKVTATGGEFTIQGLAKGPHLLQGECSIPGYAPFSRTVTVADCFTRKEVSIN